MSENKHEVELKPVHCPDCDVLFGVSVSFMKRRKEDYRVFYCPNGHPQWYPARCVCGANFGADDALREHEKDCGVHIDTLLGIGTDD